jgi:hypothetical protein
MCEVCLKKTKKNLGEALAEVLGDRFVVLRTSMSHDRRFRITNLDTKKAVVIEADGDEGGYFHWGR